MRTKRLILAFGAAAMIFLLYRQVPSVKTAAEVNTPGLYTVVRAVDGDTLDVSNQGFRDTVRLIGADTPEIHNPKKPVQCYGNEAAAFTRSLTEGKQVRLEPDPKDSNRDKYGRLLRYVYLPDGSLLNKRLVSSGYAFAYKIFAFSRLDEFETTEQQAKISGVGLWSACRIDSSQAIEQTNPI